MINLSCHWTRGWVLSYFEPSWLVDQRLPFDQPIVIKHWPPTSFWCENMTPDASEWDADARTNHPWDNWLIPHHFVEWKRRDFVRKKQFCAHIHSTSTCVPTMRNLDFIALQSLPSCGWSKEKLTQVAWDWPFGSDWGSKNTRQPIWVNSFCAMQQWYAMNIVFLICTL